MLKEENLHIFSKKYDKNQKNCLKYLEFNKFLCKIQLRLKNQFKKGRYKHLKITDVRIRIKDEEKLKGIASITFDECFVVHDIKVIAGKDGLFISMPNKKKPDGDHKDIAHPIKTETREMIKEAVLTAYNQALETQPE